MYGTPSGLLVMTWTQPPIAASWHQDDSDPSFRWDDGYGNARNGIASEQRPSSYLAP